MLPEGRGVANLKGPYKELIEFTGEIIAGVSARGPNGEGYLLIEKGTPAVAQYNENGTDLRGNDAIIFFREQPHLEYTVSSYTESELRTVITHSIRNKWLVDYASLPDEDETALSEDEKLDRILRQPGVIAVSSFYEGFPVNSRGNGDFEHVAAIAEDLLRAGAKISDDLEIGLLEQIILETPEGKCILAPFGDLFLVVLTSTGANLGLIRLAIKGVQ
ncbi:roadblock/LC7 domain-containing protein [Methanogenium organophilum]|uniref:Roadblock/LC7 domain-containing protein n=1 Tax=Methanogenium organophilum TaxID=2199 RepID=A0A9X9S4G9_METOG|nr:roadblock/LC7 domain-containing protein [Methanogenium organophilum]WAI00740.1 roadblock/LC7 domain-containing protein [Methanogenium organophilum]